MVFEGTAAGNSASFHTVFVPLNGFIGLRLTWTDMVTDLRLSFSDAACTELTCPSAVDVVNATAGGAEL